MAGKEAADPFPLQIGPQRRRPPRAGKFQVQAADDGVHSIVGTHLPGPLHYVLDPGMAAADENDEALLALVDQRRVVADEILLHSPASHHVTQQGGSGLIPSQYGSQEHQPLGQPDRLGRTVREQPSRRQLLRIQIAREAVEVVAPGQQRQEVAPLIEHIRTGDQRDGLGIDGQGA